jgi:hypothetical protein
MPSWATARDACVSGDAAGMWCLLAGGGGDVGDLFAIRVAAQHGNSIVSLTEAGAHDRGSPLSATRRASRREDAARDGGNFASSVLLGADCSTWQSGGSADETPAQASLGVEKTQLAARLTASETRPRCTSRRDSASQLFPALEWALAGLQFETQTAPGRRGDRPSTACLLHCAFFDARQTLRS